VLVGMAAVVEAVAILLQARLPLVLDTSLFHTAIAVYMATIALDEIDVRDLLGRIAESRFQRIAMSLGDGLVCTDSNYRITVWNPGAAAIFGYDRAEMIGRPFDTICAGNAEAAPGSFSIRDAAHPRLQFGYRRASRQARALVPRGCVANAHPRRQPRSSLRLQVRIQRCPAITF